MMVEFVDLEFKIVHIDQNDSAEFIKIWDASDILSPILGLGESVYIAEVPNNDAFDGCGLSFNEILELKSKVRSIANDANAKVLQRYNILISNPFLPKKEQYVIRVTFFNPTSVVGLSIVYYALYDVLYC
jgi:hypothetical protein